MQWVREQMERRQVSQADLAAAIGLTEPQMSKVMGGTRMLKASEADAIRRYFGYMMPDDRSDAVYASILDQLTVLQADQKQALALYLEALTGSRR